MRIVFMGTAEFAVPALKNLILSGYDIPLIVTQPDKPAGRGRQMQSPPVKSLALEYGIDVVQPANIKTPDFAQQMAQLAPEVIVVVAYGRILPETALALPPRGCVNLHGSLLPAYRGAAPIQRAIMAGETRVGVTTMYMDKTMDTGDMILQKSITPNGTEDYGQIASILAEEGANLLLETLEQVEWGMAPRIPQDHDRASYAPPLTRDDELIKWDLPGENIRNQIRALAPSPGAYTRWNNIKIKVFRADLVDCPNARPGDIMDILPQQGFVVATGLNGLLVEEVQREGKNRMTASDFLKGNNLQVGDNLG